MYETALPIKLSSFNLNNSENKVKIEWSVAEAVNVSYFTAERSLSGKDRWISLGNVAYTEGKSGYHLIDGSPIPGTSYYRLKTTDLDGNFEYSTIRSITTTRTTDNAGSFYPNPAKGILKYKTKVTQRKISSISFLNAYGIPVLNEVNSPEHSFDVGNILPGIYIAIVSFEDGGREHHRIAITN